MNEVVKLPGRPAVPSPAKPHVFLVCIDALRADALETPGPDSIWSEPGRPATPVLDGFRRESRSYPLATASSSWTKPSVPSIFLSRHPGEHGVFEVAKDVRRGGLSAALPEDAETMAERFRAAGYRTIGLAHNAQLDAGLGFARGFDVWASDAGDGESILSALRELRPFDDGKPVFLYLHYLEPHWPYRGRVVQRAKEHATGRFPFHTFRGSDWRTLKREMADGRIVLEAEEIRFLRRVYGLAVEEADRVLGLALDWLTDTGAFERAVTCVLSDHGEELVDHGSVGHGQSVHGELVRVPLMLRAGRETGVSTGRDTVSTELASHVDVLPTLLGAAGVRSDGPVSGRDLLHAAPAEHVFSEVKHKRRYRQAVRDARWKLVRSRFFRRAGDGSAEDYNNLEELLSGREHRTELRLFDLQEDPRELTDLSAAHPAVTARLEAVLDAWWRDRRTHGRNVRAIEEDMIRRLEALGYL